MIGITSHNIDEWLFNHFEGNLNLDQQASLLDFLEANPHFKEDLDAWSNTSVESPEMEYSGMKNLLVDEAAEVVVAGAGIGAVGATAWMKWGAGVVAFAGLLFFGYQATENGSIEEELYEANALAANEPTVEATNTASDVRSELVANSPFAEGYSPASNDALGSGILATNNPVHSSENPTALNLMGNHYSTHNFTTTGSSEQLGLNATENTNEGNGFVGTLAAQDNSNDPSSFNATQNGGNEPSSLAGVVTDNSVSNPSEPTNGVADVDANNGNNEFTEEAVSDLSTSAEPFREEEFFVNRTKDLSGDKSDFGGFNDPDWGRKIMSTPSDPDGDGVRNRGHQLAVSNRQLPTTGVWPFVVPYSGLGFNNEDLDPKLIVPQNNPLSLNPAMTGNHGNGAHRLSLNARNQWNSTAMTSNSLSVGYDTYITGLRGGIGVLVEHSSYENGLLGTTTASLMYAPRFELINKRGRGGERARYLSITPAIKIGYSQTRMPQLDQSEKLVLLEAQRGQTSAIAPSLGGTTGRTQTAQDLGAGFHLNGNSFYAGVSADHLLQPVVHSNLTDGNVEQRLERKYVGYFGTNFRRKSTSPFTYSPALIVQVQGDLKEAWLSNTFQYKWLRSGIGIASNKGVRLSAGVGLDGFSVSYNYDVTESKLQSSNFGSHELSLRWLIR